MTERLSANECTVVMSSGSCSRLEAGQPHTKQAGLAIESTTRPQYCTTHLVGRRPEVSAAYGVILASKGENSIIY